MKKLCLLLINAASEEEVLKIIESDPVLKDERNWHNYGNVQNNLGTVTGQSPEPVPSLIEKITNSIDAMLIKECRLKGEKPDSRTAPQSMEEALKRYFGLTDESYSNLVDEGRRTLASNIQIIAEGSKRNPNIIIWDNGEGQLPQDFPETLVSLNKGNKRSIFFVQGKYNMGGTAVLPFCGKHRFQLIVSRKNLSKKKGKGVYGFTLIRRNRGIGENIRVSRYEYCVDKTGKIFEFESEPLETGLYKQDFDGGTYIKLFNYDLRNPSDITWDLWRELNRYLYKPALPILVYEKRYKEGHTPSKVMHGNRMRCFLDGRESIENKFLLRIKSDGVEYPVEVFVFKKSVDTKEFIKDMALAFTVNGQVQHYLDNKFISTNIKKAYLKGHVLINVDCSNMPRELHEDIFMSSRSQMRDIEQYRNLVDRITIELKDNDYLTRLDEEWRRDQIFNNPKDEQFLKRIVGKLLRDDKAIEKLLGLNGGLISNQIEKIRREVFNNQERFSGKRYPSYFRFRNLRPGKYKMLPQNGECKIDIETDVENDYLMRPHDKGEFKIRIKSPFTGGGGRGGNGGFDEELLDVSVVGPNEGSIRLRVRPNQALPTGTRIPIDLEMTSPTGPHLLTAEVVIDNPQNQSSEQEVEKKKEYSLPELIEVYHEIKEIEGNPIKTWDDYGWNELDICKIFESSQDGCAVDAIAINMESKELDSFIRSRKVAGERIEVVQRSYKTSVYLLSLVMFYELQQRLKIEEQENKYNSEKLVYEPADMVSFMMKGLAKILLHIMTNENLLKEIDSAE